MPFTFLFSASKAIHPILSPFKNPTQLDARSRSKLPKLGALGPFIFRCSHLELLLCRVFEFWISPGWQYIIFQHWTPNWLAWLFQVPTPELLRSSATPFLSLQADGIHSFLVHSRSSNTFSDLIFTACFFFALPKHISKWVVQVQFRNDFSIATSPENCSLFGIFDSNTFHTHHTPGLCCSGLDPKYTSIQRRGPTAFKVSCSICCSRSVQSRLPQVSTWQQKYSIGISFFLNSHWMNLGASNVGVWWGYFVLPYLPCFCTLPKPL